MAAFKRSEPKPAEKPIRTAVPVAKAVGRYAKYGFGTQRPNATYQGVLEMVRGKLAFRDVRAVSEYLGFDISDAELLAAQDMALRHVGIPDVGFFNAEKYEAYLAELPK